MRGLSGGRHLDLERPLRRRLVIDLQGRVPDPELFVQHPLELAPPLVAVRNRSG